MSAMDTSEGGAPVAAAAAELVVAPAAAAAAAASSSAAAASSLAPPAASSAMPSSSPAPTAADEEEEDALINDNVDEDELMDAKPLKKGRGRQPKDAAAAAAAAVGSSAVPVDALERLNDLLKQTEQFAKFVPAKAPEKKKRGKAGRTHERLEEEAEDKELVADELQQEADGKQSWPDHLDEQPTSVTKAGGLPMRDYQLEALNWLIKLHDQNLNGILADEMGLGKTLESLSLLAYLKQYRNYAGPHLIIVPKSTSSNWMREVSRWTNNLSSHRFHGNQEEREVMKPLVALNDITVTTYEMVIREKSFFGKVKWKYIYIDEAHRIKNENSLLSRVVRTFSSEHRLLITGTPLQNNLHELWALLNFLVPSLFGSSDDFDSWFNFAEASQRDEIVARLHRLLRPFLLRRLKSDVEKALLPKIETKLFVGMSAMQKAWYKKILERDIEVLNATNTSKVRLLNIVMQLRKVCNHPYLFTGAEPGPPYLEGEHIVENSSKMVLLDKLLTKLEANGNRVLIFSQMTRILDILEDFTRYRGYNICRIDGQTKQEDRDEAMELFNAPNSKKFIFLLSTRAGGLGINLQTADTVILFDSDWNPQMDLQAMDRAHRIGQKKQVTVFRFVVEHSIEQKMVERATKKLFLDALVVKQGRLNDAEKSVSSQELQEAIRFGANRIFQGTDSEAITDADIDLILARGSELTRAENEKLKANQQNDLLNFSLTDDAKTNFQMFEGKDYTGVRGKTGFEFIEPAKRERKSNYDENAYYREALRINEKKTPKSAREWKPQQRPDWQFFNTKKLNVLEEKEHKSKRLLTAMRAARKSAQKEEKRVRDEEAKEQRKQARAQKMKEQRAADAAAAAAGGTAIPAGKQEDEAMADSDDEKDGEAAAAAAATPAASPAPAAAASSDAVKMEIDGEPAVKQEAASVKGAEVKAEQAAAAVKVEADADAVVKTEETGRGKRSRGKKPEASPSPAPAAAAAAEEAEEEAGEDDDEDAQMRLQAGCLDASEQAELDRLLAEGFGSWQRRHLNSFVKAMEKFGRDDLTNIKQNVEEKTPAEVEKYYYVFWARYREIDSDKLIKQIERGEQKLQKHKEHQAIIDNKVKRFRGNFEKLTIPYPSNAAKTFTPEEDKFLIVSLHRLGYGNWEDLKSAIRSSWMFRFDWYIKSRTCGELSKRVEYLLKLLGDEQHKHLKDEQHAENKRRAKAVKEATKIMAKESAALSAAAASPKASASKSSTKKKDSKTEVKKEKDADAKSSTKKKPAAEKEAPSKKRKTADAEEKKSKKAKAADAE